MRANQTTSNILESSVFGSQVESREWSSDEAHFCSQSLSLQSVDRRLESCCQSTANRQSDGGSLGHACPSRLLTIQLESLSNVYIMDQSKKLYVRPGEPDYYMSPDISSKLQYEYCFRRVQKGQMYRDSVYTVLIVRLRSFAVCQKEPK